MKKILILANNDVGLYKFRKELIHELLQTNQVIISLPQGKLVEPLVEDGCQFIETDIDCRGINPFVDLKLIKKYFSILRKTKPDLVITYTIKPNLYGGLVSRICKVPYAINITGLGTAFQKENFVKKLVCFLYKLSSKKARVVYFENIENKEVFIQNHLIKEKQAFLLHGAGVNLDEYAFTPYPKEKEDVHFLFIGRVMKEKGIDEFIYAAQKIKKEYTNVHFDIIGPMEDNYKEIINENVNHNIINYYGYQEDVKPFIEKCHCFVLPSYHEGMSNSLLECAAMGRPLITSDIHGCKEAIDNNGFCCQVQNADSLYEQMKHFLDLNYEEKKQLGIQSRKYMEKVFDKKKVVQETIRGLKL